ncbi:MAG: DoxX family membrane protein [Candidatus Omnitrophica bacterium]|nr:DoxX family membrane protein [Candidatus Omnitrophota bacterium]
MSGQRRGKETEKADQRCGEKKGGGMNKTAVSVGLLSIRIGLGVIFLAHGLQKLGLFDGAGVDGVARMLSNWGLTPAGILAWVLIVIEIVCGLGILLGVFPRLNAVLIVLTMIVAIAKVHGPKGFFMMQGGFEYQFFIVMVSIAVIATGAGKFALWNKY